MKMGPTSANQLPARMVWCVSREAKEKLAQCATGSNPDKIRKAPVSVVIGTDTNFHEHLPELFPNDQSAKSWFDGDARRARNRRFAIPRSKAAISSSPPARWGSTPGRCRDPTRPRSRPRSSPTPRR